MKREGLYLQGGLALNSWYAETEATRNGREQSSSPRGRGGPSSPRRIFDRTGVVKSSKQASRKSVPASSRNQQTGSLRYPEGDALSPLPRPFRAMRAAEVATILPRC